MALRTLIDSLSPIGRPAAIVWFVSTIIVLAIYGQIIAITVGESPVSKWLEVLPFGANLDAASTVVLPGIGLRIRAASLHSCPNAIEAWRGFTEGRQAVCRSLHAKRVELQTSTRLGRSVSQPGSGRSEHSSAIAPAIPKSCSLAILALGSTNHCQSAEALTAGDIDQIALADRSPETPARPSARLHAESIAGNDFLIPAIADAQPCWLRSFASPAMSSNNSQITEATTHQIVGSGAIAIGYRHADNVSDGMLIVQREA